MGNCYLIHEPNRPGPHHWNGMGGQDSFWGYFVSVWAFRSWCDCFDEKLAQTQQFQPLAQKGQQWCEPKTPTEAQCWNSAIQMHIATPDFTQQNQQKINACFNAVQELPDHFYNLQVWKELKKRIYPPRFVCIATGHLPGGKNGKRFGTKWNIAVTNAERPDECYFNGSLLKLQLFNAVILSVR